MERAIRITTTLVKIEGRARLADNPPYTASLSNPWTVQSVACAINSETPKTRARHHDRSTFA